MTRKKQQRLLPLVLLLTVGFAFLHSMTWAQDSVTSTDIPIEFSGTVESVSADVAIIDQLPINIMAATSNNPLQPGQVVSVRGKLQPDGSIVAGTVDVLSMHRIAPTLLSQVPPSAETVSDTSAIPLCPLAPDDWKAAADLMPAAALSLGGQDYSQAELIALLNAEPSSDASLSLARELVAAHFNILNGADATEYFDSLFEADALLVQRGESQDRLPYGVDPVSSGGQQMLNTATLLSEFNAGQNAADCQATPSQSEVLPTITVEGLVESVTADGLVVNGLNILLDHSNASLASVQPGDYVRIEGVLVGQNSADMRVMPVNVRVDRATPVEVIPTAQPIVDSPPQESAPAAVNSEPVNPPPANPPAESVSQPVNPPPPAAENPPPAPPPLPNLPPPPENPPPAPPANPPDNGGGRGDEGMGMGRDGGGHNGGGNGNGEGMGMGG